MFKTDCAMSIPRGMTVTSGSITLKKDTQNLIGISIGGGAPLCPCLYVVQVFDNTPAAKDGQLAAGDEIVGVNGQSVKVSFQTFCIMIFFFFFFF